MNAWETALDVVHRCLRAGVGEFVICAGARNAALIEALARAEAAGLVRVWRHFEERSAGFFALGRTMETGRPCAVVTTSGTAAAELLPPVIEAYYQDRPLVAITADRPAAFRGSGAPQCIEQPGIFGVYALQGDFPSGTAKHRMHLNVEFDETLRSPVMKDFSASKAEGSFHAGERPSRCRRARPLAARGPLPRHRRDDRRAGAGRTRGGVSFLPGFRRAGRRRGHQRLARGACTAWRSTTPTAF